MKKIIRIGIIALFLLAMLLFVTADTWKELRPTGDLKYYVNDIEVQEQDYFNEKVDDFELRISQLEIKVAELEKEKYIN